MRRILLALAGLVSLAALGLLGYCSLRPLPGAGAAYQEAPDQAVAGRMAPLSLRLAVWGAGAAASERYRDVRLQWRLGGEADDVPGTGEWRELAASRVVSEAGPQLGVSHHFALPVPDAPGRQILYRFSFVFDGQPNQVEGLKTIRIEGPPLNPPSPHPAESSRSAASSG